jgi:hypothetical protein
MKKSGIHGGNKEDLLRHISEMLDNPNMELIIIEKTTVAGYRNRAIDAYRLTFTEEG